MGRSSQVWGKRFPYVSLPFCPLYLPPSQLSLLIPVFLFPPPPPLAQLVPPPRRSLQWEASPPSPPKFVYFLSPLPTAGYWLLATLSGCGWLAAPLASLPLSSFTCITEGRGWGRECPSRSPALLPSFYISPVFSPALWSCSPDSLLLLYTFLNWLTPCMAHTWAEMPIHRHLHLYTQSDMYTYTWVTRGGSHR